MLSFFAGASVIGGLLLVCYTLVYRPSELFERVMPYVATRLKRPPRRRAAIAAKILDAVGSTHASVERRTHLLGDLTTADFRIRQLQWASSGFVSGALVAFALVVRGVPVVIALVAVVIGAGAGMLGADWRLSKRVANRQKAYTAQLPDVVEILALAVASGESIRAAIDRVCVIGEGEMVAELSRTMSEVHAGQPLTAALIDMGNRSGNRNVARFSEAIVAAVEQGSGLAGSLHAQAHDARDAARRDLLEIGGKAEIAMMIPVVFIIMPLTVVFTVFPALHTLNFT
ncbi:type II secretion system F family protein [Trueperella pyogenes]|uniref:type II secretion system F family protein n=1 Tax=Trueperella pyogenes TaxID=1661 RepID=UPI00345CD16D